jgi:hypothetical protein
MGFDLKYTNFDLFTIPISLSFKQKYQYRTFIGASLSILCFVFLMIFFIIKLNQILKKSIFSITSNEFQNPKASIDFTNIPILFSLADNNGNSKELDPKIFHFSVVLSEYVQDVEDNGNSHIIYKEKEIEIDRCDNLNDSIDFSEFSEYNISYFNCIKPYQNLTINGKYGDVINGYKSLKINLKKCNNIIENCYDNKYIDSYIANTKFLIAYLGNKNNFYNFNQKDIEKTVYSRSISLSPSLCKKVIYYTTLVKYELYDNLLLNKKKEKNYFINRDMFIEFNPTLDSEDPNENNILAFFAFVYDGNMIEYTKKVEKIGEVISYIGNLFNIMLTILRIINNYISNKILFIDVFYQFFFDERFKKKPKNVHFDNSNAFLINNKLNSLKINAKTQEKSNNSNQIFNSVLLEDKSLNNINLNNSNNNNSNLNNSNNNKNALKRILTNKSIKIEKEKKKFLKESKFYYLFPMWIIKSKKNLNHLMVIKNSVCNSFSLENFLELLKIKKCINGIRKEKIHDLLEYKKSHNSDKNIRSEINKIFNYK